MMTISLAMQQDFACYGEACWRVGVRIATFKSHTNATSPSHSNLGLVLSVTVLPIALLETHHPCYLYHTTTHAHSLTTPQCKSSHKPHFWVKTFRSSKRYILQHWLATVLSAFLLLASLILHYSLCPYILSTHHWPRAASWERKQGWVHCQEHLTAIYWAIICRIEWLLKESYSKMSRNSTLPIIPEKIRLDTSYRASIITDAYNLYDCFIVSGLCEPKFLVGRLHPRNTDLQIWSCARNFFDEFCFSSLAWRKVW